MPKLEGRRIYTASYPPEVFEHAHVQPLGLPLHEVRMPESPGGVRVTQDILHAPSCSFALVALVYLSMLYTVVVFIHRLLLVVPSSI